MFTDLPRPLVSKTGFQGCFASFETNGELLDPVKHALVPSPLVEEGCEGTLIHTLVRAFYWDSDDLVIIHHQAKSSGIRLPIAHI